MTDFTNEDFVALFFYATCCGPSAQMIPLIEKAEKIFGEYIFEFINIEESPKITREMQIKGTPTLIILRNGIPFASKIGTQTQKSLNDFLEKGLS